MGASPGLYTVTLRPVSQNGLTARHRGISELLMVRQTNGINVPTNPIVLIARKKPTQAERPISIANVDVNAGDRVFVVVRLNDGSATRYILEVDTTAHAITISSQPPNRSIATGSPTTFPVTASTNDGGTLSYQWQISTNAGVSYSNLANGGVYSGVTTATLSISNVAGLTTNRYRVLINSTGGAAQLASTGGILTVT
ncbi:MAG: hypothetical protein VKI63_06125 [Cyanobium sp.]|nr:hypothetical protein [Cyanobium sp.]